MNEKDRITDPINTYNIQNPYKYKNWNIFKNSILSDLETSGCESTINGFCPETDSLEECIDIASKNNSIFGWYIKEPTNKKGICAPMVNHPYKESRPYYRLRNKSLYPYLQDKDTFVFTNQDELEFPPNKPNLIYYKDLITIKLKNQNKLLATNDSRSTQPDAIFSENNPVYLQLLSAEIIRDKVTQYAPIRNGDEVIINIPDTALILKGTNSSHEDHLSFVMTGTGNNSVNDIFKIYSKDSNKKIGDYLNYSDDLYFIYKSFPVIYNDQENSLHIIEKSLENTEKNNNDYLFNFIPHLQVYYCYNGECKSVPLKDTDMHGYEATYKGSTISRNPYCWNLCKNVKEKYTTKSSIFIIIILILVFVYFIYKKINNS